MELPAREHKYEQVVTGIADLIERGALRPGDPLPSVRELARRRSVSITTVLQGYYVLEARGLIEARPRSGVYVHTRLPAVLPHSPERGELVGESRAWRQATG